MTKKATNTLWTSTFIRLLILILFIYNGIAIINSTFSVYIVEQLNGTPADVSLASSLMIITAMLFRPVAGFLIDRFGRRITLALSLGFTALISLAYLLPQGVVGLALLRFLMGIPFAMNTTGLATLRTDLIPDDQRGNGFNISTIAIMLSALVIGPNLGYLILNTSGFGLLFPIAAGMLFMAIGNLLLMKFEDIKTYTNRLSLKEIFEPRAIWFSLILGMLFIGWPGVLTYGPLYSIEVGLSFGGFYFLSFGIGLILSQFIAKAILGENKPPALTALAIALVIAGHAVIGFLRSRAGFLGGAVLIGAGYGLSFSIFNKLAFDLVEPERRGRCSATIYIAQDIGATIGIYAYSFVAESFGSFSYSYLMAAAVTILPVILLLLFALPDYKRKCSPKDFQDIGMDIEARILN
ncbi:MAG TPA: MFS transporter [Pelolinea sp.]|nr:MFS transporter [Pelolinea sp.]